MGKEHSAEEKRPAKVPENMPGNEVMTVGAGCFWCIDSIFRHMDGVNACVVGYAGGNTINPTYEEICTGRSNHAEVVKVWFDPTKITYDRLLEIFFKVHNPTTLNR